MATTKKLMGTTAAAGGGGPLVIEDVFSTYLYTGNGLTQTITNDIDLSGEGGLVWIKGRSGAYDHHLVDTVRGNTKIIFSNLPAVESTVTTRVTGFNSDGFSLGSNVSVNSNNQTYASWTFRKAPRFFDVVTYTGDGTSNRTISHNLGSVPGCIFVKNLTISRDWGVYHRGVDSTAPEDYFLRLNDVNASGNSSIYWNDTAPTDTEFTLGSAIQVNGSGYEYVAYLFAHDPLGPSGDGSDGLIACGNFTAGSSTVVDLGWEPQWVMIKRTDSTTGGDWYMYDAMRGFTSNSGTNGDSNYLFANTSAAEVVGGNRIQLKPYGFDSTANLFSGGNYIYIAIRRGPMRQPTSGTEVFDVKERLGGYPTPTLISTSNQVDLLISKRAESSGGSSTYIFDRLRGGAKYLQGDSAAPESGSTEYIKFDTNKGFKEGFFNTSQNFVHWTLARAPGFFDVVAYTGNGVAGRTVPHNLGVAPEMMIVKVRNATNSWLVYHKDLSSGHALYLNYTFASSLQTTTFNATDPSGDVFTLGSASSTNSSSGYNYIAYLFASCPGVSKVGSYTGNGTTLNVDCGFTTGARFVMIKRTDTTENWHVFDTARGINAGDDPAIRLDTDASEFNSAAINPYAAGFQVEQSASCNNNVSGGKYVYLAIA